jgi:putative transferase (TIGR04331 family)
MTKQLLLVTTGSEPEIFKSDSRCLFLGDWCSVSGLQDIDSSSTVNTLRHPWESHENYERDYSRIDTKYKEMLRILSLILSEEHDVFESERYWQIILGSWLSRFVTAIFEHNLLISDVIVKYPKSQISYMAPKFDSNMAPTATSDALLLLESREFNALLYSELLSVNKNSNISLDGEYPLKSDIKKTIRPIRTTRKILSRLLDSTSKIVSFKNILVVPYLSYRDRFSISWKSKRFLLFSLPVDRDEKFSEIDSNRRDHLCKKAFAISKEKDKILISLMIKYLPKSFLECFQFYASKAKNKTKGTPSVIINGIGDILLESEVTRFWLAENVMKGAYLVTKQHGGVYGSAKFMMIEDMQRSNADLFLSWGWSDMGVRAMPMRPQRPWLRPLVNSGRVTVVKVAFPLFFYHIFPSPQSAKFAAYIRSISNLCVDLDGRLDLDVNLRVYPQDFSWGVADVVKGLPVKVTSAPSTTLEEDCQSSALAIIAYDATSHLNLLRHNYPTLFLFDEDYYQPRLEIKSFFDELEAVGVLHKSNESLISFLNGILPDVQSWWNSIATQSAIHRFRQSYLKQDDFFAEAWSALLDDIEAEKSAHIQI